MPLAKLFHRRNSSQKDRKKSLPSPELSGPESTAEGSVADKQDQAKTSTSAENKCESVASSEENKSLNLQSDLGDDGTFESPAQSETSRRCSVPDASGFEKQIQKKSRSFSLNESGTKLLVQKSRRRKCESESAAFSSTDDEGFEDKIIQLRERDLEKVIGQCVDKLIRESIITAVKSVKVDNIYEDVIKSLSRSASESSESSGGAETVQQKLHTKSVTEYADLQMLHTFEEEKLEEEVEETEAPKLHKNSETLSEVSDQFQPSIQNENDKNGYTEIEKEVKVPEPETCAESDLKTVNKTVNPKESAETAESDAVIQLETDEKEAPKSVELGECVAQNEKTPTEVQLSDVNNLETFNESETGGIKDAELHETISGEQTNEIKQCSESLQETKQNDIAEDTVDWSSQKKDPAPQEEIKEAGEIKDELIDETDNCKVEKEEFKDIAVDGYHADIEESISLHSLASEYSFDNIKSFKGFLRTMSDDTVISTDESTLGGQLDSTLKKDPDESQKPPLDVGETLKNLNVEADLMAMSGDDFSHLLTPGESANEEVNTPVIDLGENLPEQKPAEEEKKVNWKVGYLHVKLPHKSRHKGLKVWKKRCVGIQPDEFASDDSDPCLVLSVYSGDSSAAKKHSASFWKSISCQKAVIYRSSSRTHPYSFSISDDKKAIIHLSADSEAISQEWMAAIRAILWPPSPVVQLEKMLNGREFEISIIDNEFSYHAGLLGMYGYLTITPKKLILVHPQQGYVIQEWYLNTIDKFQLIPQTRIEDINKVLSMTTCSDSSTGKGEILIFCKEAVSLLQAIASTIHQILTQHSKQEGGKYQKELEEIGAWLVADSTPAEDYYKVPPRQVKSLLDVPNFIFNKPLTPVATVVGAPGLAMDSQKQTLGVPTRASQDSGISSETVSDDFLNCSTASFKLGGGGYPGKSSDSELSDTYTPPRSPEVRAKRETEVTEAKTKA